MSSFFSSARFAQAWQEHHRPDSCVLALEWSEGGRRSTMHGVLSPAQDGGTSAEFAPAGLYAQPEPFVPAPATIRHSLARAQAAHRISQLTWYVRFDDAALAATLGEAGLDPAPYETQVVVLDAPHAEIFARYRKTRRNEIRQAQRKGCRLRRAATASDVHAYCRVHETLATQKNDFRVKYSAALLAALVQMTDDTTLLLAEVGSEVVAGALFFRHADALVYWHGAANRDYAEYFPTGVLVDAGLQLAGEMKLAHFDLGASASAPLADFKASFGASTVRNWTFTYRPPYPLRLRVSETVRRWLGVGAKRPASLP